ncbi:hypothetical protein HDU96_002192, partial [Phlyctochytrium bullatum]
PTRGAGEIGRRCIGGRKWGSDAGDLLEELVDCGVELNAKDSSGMTALHVAAQASKTELLVPLLGVGVDSEVRSEDGDTWINVALSVGLERWVLEHADELEEVGVEVGELFSLLE